MRGTGYTAGGRPAPASPGAWKTDVHVRFLESPESRPYSHPCPRPPRGASHPDSSRSPPLMPAFVTKEAPDFTADAVVNNEFKTIKLSDYKGKYVVLFFYPLDFTFVCPTEISAFSDKVEEFRKRGAEVLGVSVDSKFSHLAWIRTNRADGGLGGLKYPLVSDLTKTICADYGVLLENGVSLR